MMIRKLGKTIAATALAVSLAFAPTLTMADEGDAAPSGAARVGAGIVDVLFGRTTLLMATVAGSAFYVSGMLTKQGVTLWSTQPRGRAFSFEDVSSRVAEETPICEVVRDFVGVGKIAAATVVYSGDTPASAVLVCDLPENRRTIVRSEESRLMTRVTEEEVCGRDVEISPSGPEIR